MVIEESSLRQLLASTYGPQCGHAIIECVQRGGAVSINMDDGTQRVLRSIEETEAALREHFHWTASSDA